MQRFLKLLALCGLAAALCLPSAAAEIEGRWGTQLEAGLWKLVEGYWDHSNIDNFTGLAVRRGLSNRWLAELSYRYGTVRPGVDDPNLDAGWTTSSYFGLYTEIHNPTLNVQYLFLPASRLSPFMGFGLGLTAWRVLAAEKEASFFPTGTTVQGFDDDGDRYQALKKTDFTLAIELGAEWFVSERFSLRLGGRYHVMPGNDLDNIGLSSWDTFNDPSFVDANRGLIQGFLGATLWFGQPAAWDPAGWIPPPPLRPAAPPPAPAPEPKPEPEPEPTPEPEPEPEPMPEPEPEPEPAPEIKALATGLILEDVTFRSGSAQLTPGSMAILTRMADLLKQHSQVRIEVRGHTDATGSPELNRELSQRRAVAVRDALILLGVAPSRITAVGYGPDYPIAPNNTAEGRQKNRRVELQRID